jgi:hypothetical protein
VTDIKKLELLADYQFLCYSVTAIMLQAYEYYESGDDELSWRCLLSADMFKDEREQAWAKIRPHYGHACLLKEGA